MNDLPDCRPDGDLRRFLLGQLPEADAVAIEQHLSGCSRCLDTIGAMRASDTLLEAMQSQATADPHPEADVVRELVTRLSGLHPASSANPLENQVSLAPPQTPEELGRLGGYRILKMLGVGGMGIVFEAEDPRLRRRVALKVMTPALAQIPANRERFVREAQATAAIEHDHVVTIHQVGEDGGVPFLAMPLLKGETLEDAIGRTEGEIPPVALTIGEILRIGREIASGLAAAHAQGLTHRDVKPANIWLEKSGRVKILDFGLARPQQDNAQLTQSGLIAGTPQYMAPEQATGKKVDHLADLFALGCVLYRLTTGRLPFDGPDSLAILHALALDQPPAPRQLNPNVPPALSDLTMRLLAKEPHDRPQSATEVAVALEAIGRSHLPDGTTTGREGPARQGQPALITRRATYITAALLLIAAPLAAWYAPAIYRIATNQGLLVIETDDPAVEVTVKQDGELIKIVDRKTGKYVTLKAGVYQLELSDDNWKQGLKLETNQFTLTRGGREIARVRREPSAAPVPVPAATAASGSPTFPFMVLSSGEMAEQKFPALTDAVEAAQGGDTIEIRGNGPFVLQPIHLRDKPLTLRAGAGFWPVLALAPEAVAADLPLLTTGAALRLEGLEFHRDAGGKPGANGLMHIHSQRAPLAVANCRFVLPPKHPGLIVAIRAENSPAVQVHNGLFLGDWHAGLTSFDVVTGSRMVVANCLFLTRNTALTFVNQKEVTTASLHVLNNTMISHGDAVSIPIALGKPLKENLGPPPIRLEIRRNFGATGFLNFLYYSSSKETDDYFEREMRSLPLRLFTWEDQGNHFAAGSPLVTFRMLKHDGGDHIKPAITTLDEFKEYWKLGKTDSSVGPIRFRKELSPKTLAPEKLSPEDFRVEADGPAFKGLGADVDLVGPGPAYERWKATPAYQEWLKAAGPTP